MSSNRNIGSDLNADIARQLCALTKGFYERAAESFSATRQSPWSGWGHVWKLVERHSEQPVSTYTRATLLKVLDVGCGNLRFERFLKDRIGNAFHAWAIDDCEILLATGLESENLNMQNAQAAMRGSITQVDPAPSFGFPAHITIRQLDVMAALADGASAAQLANAFNGPPCDLAVAFGFLHHVPCFEWRVALLQAMLEALRPGGLLAVSFWQFADDPRLRAKAEEATTRGCQQLGLPPLPQNDYLLGWQDDANIFRYCHHFSEAESDQLAAALAPQAREVARFSADGRSGTLNRYLMLQRLPPLA